MRWKMSYLWIGIWLIFLIVGMQTSWFDALSNKGFQIIHHEYYRLITGLFLHVNHLHFAVNALAISYLDIYIDQRIKAGTLFFISLLGGTIAHIIFSLIYPESTSVGGSPVIFSLLGFILIMRSILPKFHFRSLYGKWIIVYVIFAQIPFFSSNISTFVIHFISFIIGMLLAYLYRQFKGVKL